MGIVLWLIVIAEGFAVLSVEVSVIRLLMPYVGSGVEVTSILITAVLLPLAYGYAHGGRFKGDEEAVRLKLKSNFFNALLILAFGLSFWIIEVFYAQLMALGITNHLWVTTLYAGLFLIYPVFLLAQTLPLMGHYCKDMAVNEATGRLLFVSTLGSFLGAILTTLVLMNWIGVSYTCLFILLVLTGMCVGVSRLHELEWYIAVGICTIFGLLSATPLMEAVGVVAQTPYSHIEVLTSKDGSDRVLRINHSLSSMDSDTERFEYIAYIEERFLKPIEKPMDVLVLGAGGFTLGSKDTQHQYDFVDIEPKLQEIAEEYILKRPLGDNVAFYPDPAVVFLRGGDKLYDLVVVDVYSNQHVIPPHLATYGFYDLVKTRVKMGGKVVLNVIGSPVLADTFSRRLDNTIHAAFPGVVRLPLKPYGDLSNMLYIYQHSELDQGIYTDNKTTASIDR